MTTLLPDRCDPKSLRLFLLRLLSFLFAIHTLSHNVDSPLVELYGKRRRGAISCQSSAVSCQQKPVPLIADSLLKRLDKKADQADVSRMGIPVKTNRHSVLSRGRFPQISSDHPIPPRKHVP